jgi:uncharacterized protein YggE
VTGTGVVYLVPDIAYINVGVQTQSESVTDAVSQNSTQAQAIRDALTALGIAEADIQTSGFNVYPAPIYGLDGTITSNTYYASNQVNVTVRDLASLGSLLDTVVRTGVNTINGISFDVQDRSAALSEARLLAIQDAETQAGELAAAVNAELGEVQTVTTTYGTVMDPYLYGMGGGGAAMAASPAVPVASGQLAVTVSATVSYQMH